MSNDDVKSAVRRLRLALEKTQTEFGALIGKGLATVQRYETLVPPKGKVLVRLQRLAESKGVDECAVIFRDALLDELGVGGLQSDEVRPPAAVSVGFYAHPQTPEEEEMVFDVLQVMREARSTSVPPNSSVQLRRDQAIANVKLLKKATKSARTERVEAVEFGQANEDQKAAIVRLFESGKSASAIEDELSLRGHRVWTSGGPVSMVDAVLAEHKKKSDERESR
jgi:transcriptional regulator with XRE-family HTH domain